MALSLLLVSARLPLLRLFGSARFSRALLLSELRLASPLQLGLLGPPLLKLAASLLFLLSLPGGGELALLLLLARPTLTLLLFLPPLLFVGAPPPLLFLLAAPFSLFLRLLLAGSGFSLLLLGPLGRRHRSSGGVALLLDLREYAVLQGHVHRLREVWTKQRSPRARAGRSR